MDEDPLLSNTAGRRRLEAGPAPDAAPHAAAPSAATTATTLPGALAAWNTSLGVYSAAIRAYMREAGDAGPRTIGQRWSAAERLLAAAEGGLRTPVAGDEPQGLAALMAAGDAAEDASRALDSAAGIALDSNVQAAVLAGMSRTYSENLKGLGRGVLEAGLAARVRYREAAAAASAAGAAAGARLGVGAITAAYDEKPGRGGVATELYVSALLCRAAGGPGALAPLETAKDAALGLAPDTPAAASADAAVLSEYHPLQAMSYAPAAFGPPRELKEGAPPATDLSLPQARLAVVYDLAPLVDRRRALAHGPLASMTTGLNFRLIERLRTIRAAPYKQAAPASGLGRVGTLAGPLSATTDGKTVCEIAAGPGVWAPFAGGRPRVEAHSAASATIILAAIREDRADGWGLDLRERYENAVRGELLPSGECDETALIAALLAEFERAYDAAPPDDSRAFRDLVVPEGPGPGDYLCTAAARLGFAALDERLRALHVKPAAVRVPHAVVVREARITQAIQTVDVGRKLWNRVKDAYRPDPEAFTLPAGQKKAALMASFRRIATDAARAGPVDCSPPTLKGFAAAAPRLV